MQVKVDLSEEEAQDAAARRAAMQGGPDKTGLGMKRKHRAVVVLRFRRASTGSATPATPVPLVV